MSPEIPLAQTILNQRVDREREAHTERDVLAESIRLKEKFPHLATYPSKQRLFAEMDALTADLKGKTILDYGCGRGTMAMRYLANGAERVSGIDISQPYITDLAKRAEKAGYAAERCDFRVMDAHKLDYPDASFDLVVGYGILHHLDPKVALAEISRVLKPHGRVLLQEPLADHPLLKIFRKLTPKARTEDEAPFTKEQIQQFERQSDWSVESGYCGILEMPLSILTSKLLPKSPNSWLMKLTDTIESWLHRQHWLLSWNQYVVFNFVKAAAQK
jgi:ubiquinone/menaquinone biosynthesis C-methylase UbiE